MDDKNTSNLTDEQYVNEKIKRYGEYKTKLEEHYWPNFKANKEMYAGYNPAKPDAYQTNTARGIVESTVNKVMTANRKVGADIHGPIGSINRKIEQTLASLADSIFDDKKLAKRHGSYRASKEMLVRDLLTIGNAVGEKNYEYLTTERDDGGIRILADGVYQTALTYDQYVFNPAYTWNTSPEKYIHKTASFDTLQEQEYKEWTEDETEEAPMVDETGQPIINPATGQPIMEPKVTKVKKSSGIYKNLDKVKEIASEKGKLKDWVDGQGAYQAYAGDGSLAPRWVEDLDIIVCWDGAQLCVIVEDKIIIRDEYDPFSTGGDNIVTAMLIEETGRPIGWGLIDHIRGLIQIKDDSLNQRKAILERALKIGGLYDDTDKAKLWMIGEVIRRGGVGSGDGSKFKEINTINPSIANALLSPAEINAEIQQSSLYSPYEAGQTSQETDKTQGTATGITKLQNAAAPNTEVVLTKVQEQIDTPFLDFALVTMANASEDDDVRFVMRAGGSSEAVGITKRFLQGRPTGDDLVLAGILSQEEADKFMAENPKLMTAPYVDEDLLITVSLDPSNAADKYERAQAEKALVDQAVQLGLPVNVQKAYTTIAEKMGFEDFGENFYSPEEVQQKQTQQQEQQQGQMEQDQQLQAGTADAEHQKKMELMQASQSHEVAMKGAQHEVARSAQLQDMNAQLANQPQPVA